MDSTILVSSNSTVVYQTSVVRTSSRIYSIIPYCAFRDTNMNLVNRFHYLVFFVSCFVADKAVLSSGEKTSEDWPICRTQYSSLFHSVERLGKKCHELAEPNYTLNRSATIEELRNFFSHVCQRYPLEQNCMAETTANVTACHDEPFLQTFKIYSEAKQKIYDIGCSENGEKFATLVHGVTRDSNYQVAVMKCSARYGQIYEDLDNSELDVSSKLFHLFKEVNILSECFNQAEDIDDSFKDVLKLFLEPVIKTMKCVNPQGGELVPCGTIDASLITPPNICDVRTFGTNETLYDTLEANAGFCIMDFVRNSDSELTEEEIRENIQSECRAQEDLPYCYKRAKIVSEICLDNSERKQFTLLGDFFQSARHILCSEGDKRLADILTEIYRHKTPGQDIFVWECINVAQNSSNKHDEHRNSSKNMRFYHEVEAFKGCLVNKLQGHQPSIDAVTSLTNDLLKKVKCVHPEDGTTVLCETLHHTA